ncbi:MAG: hypothetical protein U5L09_10280 [Bacteroidales bacterium]|nr:hypothetical protein [Bacteroidales bacterium]
MKNLNIFIVLFFALISINVHAQEKLKRYEKVKSGLIEDETTISGKVMGSTIERTAAPQNSILKIGAAGLKRNRIEPNKQD